MKYRLLKNVTSIMGFSIPIISELCIFIDWAIYAVASMALQTFYKMAEISANMFSATAQSNAVATMESILSRVMVLAGVFALFRLGIMLINYMISPENTKKLGQTGTDFVKSVIIAVVLLAASKTIFTQLGKFQWLVINNDKLIPKLVYGTDENPVTYSDKKEADMFTNKVWSVFFQPNNKATSGGKQSWEKVRNADANIASMIGRNYNEFDYYPFISGLVGMMLVYYFVIFSVELGSRVIKLVVLQVLSPIPIIMSVDPSQKNKLTNFWKAYFAIYIQIFVRVLTLYIAFIVLDMLQEALKEFGSGLIASTRLMAGNFVIDVIMVFAVFQAAKELPKVVEDALGLKLGLQTSGKGGFANLVGGLIGGSVGLIGGGIAGAVGAYGGSLGTRISAGLVGGVTGLYHGANGGSRGKGVADRVMKVTGAVRKSNALGGAIRATDGAFNYFRGGIENVFGAQRRDQATLESYDKQIKEQDDYKKMYESKNEGRRKEISDREKQIQILNRGEQLRNNILNVANNSFVQDHGSLEAFMSRDAELSRLKETIRINNENGFYLRDDNEDYRQLDLDRVTQRQSQLTSQYEGMKETYFENLFNGSTASQNTDISTAMNEYNNYLSDNGLQNRGISSYRAVPGDINSVKRFDQIRDLDKLEVRNLEADINKYQKEIQFSQTKSNMRDGRKKDIEAQKEKFKNDPRTRSHDKDVRATAPLVPPRPIGGRPPRGPHGPGPRP